MRGNGSLRSWRTFYIPASDSPAVVVQRRDIRDVEHGKDWNESKCIRDESIDREDGIVIQKLEEPRIVHRERIEKYWDFHSEMMMTICRTTHPCPESFEWDDNDEQREWTNANIIRSILLAFIILNSKRAWMKGKIFTSSTLAVFIHWWIAAHSCCSSTWFFFKFWTLIVVTDDLLISVSCAFARSGNGAHTGDSSDL